MQHLYLMMQSTFSEFYPLVTMNVWENGVALVHIENSRQFLVKYLILHCQSFLYTDSLSQKCSLIRLYFELFVQKNNFHSR